MKLEEGDGKDELGKGEVKSNFTPRYVCLSDNIKMNLDNMDVMSIYYLMEPVLPYKEKKILMLRSN